MAALSLDAEKAFNRVWWGFLTYTVKVWLWPWVYQVGHIPRHLAMVKCGGLFFQFCMNDAILDLIVTVGKTSMHCYSVPVSMLF